MDTRIQESYEKWCGMRVEKTCYIFAIINVILVCLCVLGCIVTMGFLTAQVTIGLVNNSLFQYLPTWTVIYPVYAVVCFGVAIYGIFAVVLLQGIRKNQPKLMMAYLLFGLILEMLMIMATATYTAVVVNRRSPECVLLNGGVALAIVICVIYASLLCLVRRAYLVLSSKTKRNYNVNEQTVLYISES